MRRRTFVIQIHPDGLTTLENIDTLERVAIGDPQEIPTQVQAWLTQEVQAGASCHEPEAGLPTASTETST